MHKNKELRWFSEKENATILSWFNNHNMTFENTPSVVDYYLPIHQEDITVKMRENSVEIKQRVSDPVPTTINENAEGFLEEWTKWNFNINANDALPQEILHSGKSTWIKTTKTRLRRTLNADNEFVGIDDIIPAGCQVEYEKVVINNNTYYTFSLEWFGDKFVNVPKSVVNEIVGDSVLRADHSIGFGEFIKNHFG